MKLTLFYSSYNPAERAIAKAVWGLRATPNLAVAVVDVAGERTFREAEVAHVDQPIDRHVRCYPTAILDTDDGSTELARWEEAAITPAAITAAAHTWRSKSKAQLASDVTAAKAVKTVPGGARPCAVDDLRSDEQKAQFGAK